MDILVIAVFFVFLGTAAYSDYKKREVPDALPACLWLLAFLFVPFESYFVMFAFTFAFILNTLFNMVVKRPLLSWGDLLVLPPFLALTDAMFHHLGFFIAVGAICIGVIWSGLRKEGEKGEPLVTWMFVCAVFLALAWIILDYLWP